MKNMNRIMTVCTGNICRSPVAEYLIREYAHQAGLSITVDSSAITSEEEGNPIDRRAHRVLTEHGIDARAHRATVFTTADFDRYDLILAMDTPHYRRLNALARTNEDRAKIRMMRSYDPQMAGHPSSELGIYDPWYGDMKDFYITFEMIDTAARGLIDTLSAQVPSGTEEQVG